MSNHKDTKSTRAGRTFVRLVSLWFSAVRIPAMDSVSGVSSNVARFEITLDQPTARQD